MLKFEGIRSQKYKFVYSQFWEDLWRTVNHVQVTVVLLLSPQCEQKFSKSVTIKSEVRFVFLISSYPQPRNISLLGATTSIMPPRGTHDRPLLTNRIISDYISGQTDQYSQPKNFTMRFSQISDQCPMFADFGSMWLRKHRSHEHHLRLSLGWPSGYITDTIFSLHRPTMGYLHFQSCNQIKKV